jgi:hypothetical protein
MPKQQHQVMQTMQKQQLLQPQEVLYQQDHQLVMLVIQQTLQALTQLQPTRVH